MKSKNQTKHYDVIVIGAGTAGYVAAKHCAQHKLKVAIVENLLYGGTCALRGCNPKKILLNAAEAIYRFNHLKGKGLSGSCKVNWSELIKFKQNYIKNIPQNFQSGLKKLGVKTLDGTASFIAENKLSITKNKKQTHILTADNIVIATGACPRPLNFPGAEHLITSDQFLELKRLPRKIIFAGGGYISFEFAHICAQAGATPIILNDTNEPLAIYDQQVVNMLLKATQAQGIKVHLNKQVNEIRKKSNEFQVICGKKNKTIYQANLVVHGAGRVPNTSSLNLDLASIATNKKGIILNDFLQSKSNPRIYVAGDVNPNGIPLTTTAIYDGKVVGTNIVKTKSKKATYYAVPSTAFTFPQLAGVGLTEKQAKDKKTDVIINYKDTSQWSNTTRAGFKYSCLKTIINKKDNKLLGAFFLSEHAEETINLIALAMKHKLTATQLKELITTYPSQSNDLENVF